MEAIGLQRVVVSGQPYTVDECKVPDKAISLCVCLCVSIRKRCAVPGKGQSPRQMRLTGLAELKARQEHPAFGLEAEASKALRNNVYIRCGWSANDHVLSIHGV